MLGVLRSGGARAGILVLGCSMVGHVANYLFYVVAARSLTPAQFADVSAMTALGTIAFIGDMAPGYYLSLIALLSLASLFTIRKLGATA